MKKIIFIISSLLIFFIFNYSIYEKEKIKESGEIILLELAPVDPRSMIQGDYMRLRYTIENNCENNPFSGMPFREQERNGYIVVIIDDNKVARFKRFHHQEDLAAGEKLLRYNAGYFCAISIAPNSFMFQEGQAKFYQQAKYGIFKLGSPPIKSRGAQYL